MEMSESLCLELSFWWLLLPVTELFSLKTTVALAGMRVEEPSSLELCLAQGVPWQTDLGLFDSASVSVPQPLPQGKSDPRNTGSWWVSKSTHWEDGITLPLGYNTRAEAKLWFHFRFFIFHHHNFQLLRIRWAEVRNLVFIQIKKSRGFSDLSISSSLWIFHINIKYFTLLSPPPIKSLNKIQHN